MGIIVSVDKEQSEKDLPSTDDEDEGDDAMYVGNKTKGMQLPIDDENDFLHMNSLDNIDNDMYVSDCQSDDDVVTPMVVVNEGNKETKGDNDDSADDDNDILYTKSSKGG